MTEAMDLSRWMGLSGLFDPDDFVLLVSRLVFDLLAVTIVVRSIYQRRHGYQDYAFTYYLFNAITFVLCLMLRKIPGELGFALALFGIFAMLRYRTEQIRIRDLTYLFIVIGLGLLNAIANELVSLAELVVANALVVGLTALLQRPSGQRSTTMLYDSLELLRPGNEQHLLADLSERTGYDVRRVDVMRLDTLRDGAEITIHYGYPSRK